MARGPSDTGLLGFLYGTAPGRLLLRPLTARWLSRLAGRFMDSRLSRPLIAPFIRKKAMHGSPLFLTSLCRMPIIKTGSW